MIITLAGLDMCKGGWNSRKCPVVSSTRRTVRLCSVSTLAGATVSETRIWPSVTVNDSALSGRSVPVISAGSCQTVGSAGGRLSVGAGVVLGSGVGAHPNTAISVRLTKHLVALPIMVFLLWTKVR
jgi:hypothetical protein